MMVSHGTTVREAWNAYSLSVLREKDGRDQHLVERRAAFEAGARAALQIILRHFDATGNIDPVVGLRHELMLTSDGRRYVNHDLP
jgi:hypothetical protein